MNHNSLAHNMVACTKMLLAPIFPSREQDLAQSKSLGAPHIQAAVTSLPRGLKSYSLPFSHQGTNAERKNIIKKKYT